MSVSQYYAAKFENSKTCFSYLLNNDSYFSHSPGVTSPITSNQQTPTPSNLIEDVNVQYLKELQLEKDSLESSATEEILKGHTLKLLENGNSSL